MSEESHPEQSRTSPNPTGLRKYKIGKVKQTPTVQIDSHTGYSFIQLKNRADEKVYGCTKFLNHYKEQKKLGQGTFGEVYKGIHLETQRQVAMKKIIINMEKNLFPITAQREITILKKLNHPNVLKLLEMVYDFPPSSNQSSHSVSQDDPSVPKPTKSFYMILPYMVADLSGVLHNPRMILKMADIKNMMLQTLEGLNYIHCSKYMHRDIKTANLLIDHNGILKIADFGLARLYYGCPPNLKYPGGAGTGAKYTSVVVTRWYRAPELVLGDKYYTTAVDIWGVGCVFAEFFEKKPILQGSSDIDQGHVIFKLLGTPTEEEWEIANYLPGRELLQTKYKSTLKERFGKYLNDTGLHFLGKLLALDPLKRYTAMSAKLDAFFTEEPLPSEKLTLLCEESHEADIKRYKEEMHQSMSQKAPTAPQGHIFETPNNPNTNYNVTPKEPTNKVIKMPPSGPANMKMINNITATTTTTTSSSTASTTTSASVNGSTNRYTSKSQPHNPVYHNGNGKLPRSNQNPPIVSTKLPSRYNATGVPPTGPSNKQKYNNDYSRNKNNQYPIHTGRYQPNAEYNSSNRYSQEEKYSYPPNPTQIEVNSKTRSVQTHASSRYNRNNDIQIPTKPLNEAYKNYNQVREFNHNQQTSKSHGDLAQSHPSRYQPSKPISKNIQSDSLLGRITANPIDEDHDNEFIEKNENNSKPMRSYSFNSVRKPRINNHNNRKPSQERNNDNDDNSNGNANLADLY